MQSVVDSYFEMFVADVAKGRKVTVDAVRNGYGEGRELLASDALAAGMADRIATTENVVAEMLSAAKDSPTAFTDATFVERLDRCQHRRCADERARRGGRGDDRGRRALRRCRRQLGLGGNRAMGECSTASQYSSICAGVHGAGQAVKRQHYAASSLPRTGTERGRHTPGALPSATDQTDQPSGRAEPPRGSHARINRDANATALPGTQGGRCRSATRSAACPCSRQPAGECNPPSNEKGRSTVDAF